MRKRSFHCGYVRPMAAQHQYSVGDNVYYRSARNHDYRAPGVYRVVRLRPSEGPDRHYWVRSALESFDRIAAESELGIILPHPNTRTTRRFVTIATPFRLKGMEEERPAGEYEVTTTEEAFGDLMFDAYRRISTTIYLPPGAGDVGLGDFIETDPAELDNVLKGPAHGE